MLLSWLLGSLRAGAAIRSLYYGDPVNWTPTWAGVTAIGTVLAGFALPLAFIQLGALRQDRLRAQVSKVGGWVGTPEQESGETRSWSIPVRVRNGSELPVRIDALDLTIRPWGYRRALAAPEGTTEVDYYMDKRFGSSHQTYFAPGTIAPGDTWGGYYGYGARSDFERPQPPMAFIARVVITDAAGYQWEVRSGKVGPARRVHRWRRWWWKRHRGL